MYVKKNTNIQYIGTLCRENIVIEDDENDKCKQELIVFMTTRHTLIILKRTHKKNKHSSHHTIVRAKALIACPELHKEFDARLPNLDMSKWVNTRGKLSKKKGKRAVEGGSKKFYLKLIKYLEIQYYEQYNIMQQRFPKFCSKLTNIVPWNDKQRKENIVICYLLTKSKQHDPSKDLKDIMEYFDGKKTKDDDDDEETKESEPCVEQSEDKSNGTDSTDNTVTIDDNNNDAINYLNDNNTIYSSNHMPLPFMCTYQTNSVYLQPSYGSGINHFDDNCSMSMQSTIPSTPMSHGSFFTNSDSYSMISNHI